MSGSHRGRNHKRTALIVGGTLLGLFFLYLAFRDISLSELVDGVRRMNPIYLVPSAGLLLVIQLVRAYRFGLIVRPFCPMGIKDLWDLTNIWAALNLLMPARLAELVRPYLLRQAGASFASGFGAVMVERFFDLLGLLTLLAVVLWGTPEIPATYSSLGTAMLVILVTAYTLVLVVLAKRELVQRIADRLLGLFPENAASFLGGVFRRLIDGLGIMASGKQALIIFALSIAIWTLFACMTYLFLLAFSIKARFLVAITIQVFICLGVALPSAPGFIGTFHAAGRYALAIFGVAAVPAVSFATVYHIFNMVLCLLLGGISHWSGRFSFEDGIFDLGRQDDAALRERISGNEIPGDVPSAGRG